MFRYSILIGSYLFAMNLAAQQWTWVNQVGNTSGNTVINKISPCASDQFLIAGSYGVSSLQLGSVNLSNAGQEDAFAALCNAEGEYLWSTSIGGTGQDAATAVCSDKEGNIYVGGTFKSLTLIISGITIANRGDKDVFLVKYKPDKSVEWALSFATEFTDELMGVAVDKNGTIFIGGHFINSSGSTPDRTFVMALHPVGSILWQKFANTTSGSVSAASFAIDSASGCYLAGSFSGKLTFDNGSTISSTTGSSGFIIKYSSNGTFVNAISSSTIGRFNDISIRGEQLMACGEKINYGMGWGWPLSDSKIYLARFSLNLVKVWEKSTGGTVSLQSLDIVKSLSVDEYGNAYLCGYFFSPSLWFAGDTLRNIFNKDYYYQQIFILKYDDTGNEIWGQSLGGHYTDESTAIHAIGNDQILLAGTFESDSLQIGEHRLYNNGSLRQIYVHLRPYRYSRNAIAFLTLFRNLPTVVADIGQQTILPYPNPVSDVLHLHWNELGFSPDKITIYSMDGKRMEECSVEAGKTNFQKDVSHWQQGVYVIMLSDSSHQALARFVKK